VHLDRLDDLRENDSNRRYNRAGNTLSRRAKREGSVKDIRQSEKKPIVPQHRWRKVTALYTVFYQPPRRLLALSSIASYELFLSLQLSVERLL